MSKIISLSYEIREEDGELSSFLEERGISSITISTSSSYDAALGL